MENKNLQKTLKPSGVFAIALGSIIGFGCFVLPGNWLLDAGPIGATIAFAIAIVMILVIGNSYGYMVEKLPLAGGAVVYAYRGFGRKHAFLCGWLLSLGFLSVIALNAMALPVLVRFIAPNLLTKGYLYTIAGYDAFLGEILLSLSVILIFGYLNIKGSDKVGGLQVLMVTLLLSSVVLLGIGNFFVDGAGISNLKPFFASDKTPIGSIISVLAIAPMAFVGFDTIPHAAEEFDFPTKLVHRLMHSSILVGGIMYIVVLLATAVVFPWGVLNESMPSWATGAAMQQNMGRIGLSVLVLGVTMGICTGINGFYLATSRLLYGMSKAQILPKWFGKLHEKYNTPSNALIFCLVLASIAPWFGRNAIIWVVDMCALGTAISFFYTCFTAVKLNKESRAGSKSYRIHMLATLFSIVFVAILIVPGSPSFMAIEPWIALAVWSIIGLIFYFTRAKEYNSIPSEELDRLVYGLEEYVEKNNIKK